MIQHGDSVPHFEVQTLDSERFSYSTLWQKKILVLVTTGSTESEAARAYVSDLNGLVAEFRTHDAQCLVTRDALPWLPAPGVVVADRWGEVALVAIAENVTGLPAPRELLEWVEHVETRCPECEGEAR